MVKKVCAIVEATASGILYAPLLKEQGYSCIHIRPYPEMLPVYLPTFRAHDFDADIVHSGDLHETLKRIRAFDPSFIITGNELGVELADSLTEQMGFPGNGTTLSKARRNKFDMNETLRSRGLKVTDHFKSSEIEEIVSWSQQKYPVVLKPLDSAGTDGVYFCKNDGELSTAFEKQFLKSHQLGLPNSELLVEKFIEGPEFVVNTASWEGSHLVTDFWRYEKTITRSGDILYNSVLLLPSTYKHYEALKNYTFSVLKALEIRYGAGHAEIKMTPDGPVLVEIGARAHGGGVPAMVADILGRSQISVMVDAYTGKRPFNEHLKTAYDPKILINRVFITVPKDGTLTEVNLAAVRKLKSYVSESLKVSPGTRLKKTNNLFTVAGVVYFKARTTDELVSDYKKFIEIEPDILEIEEE